MVTAKYAAQYAYEHTTSHKRVLYQVANTRAQITHCIFTDSGCGGCVCPSNVADAWVRSAVGTTVKRFITAIARDGAFKDDDFVLKEYNDVNVYVDGRTIQHAVPS